jgi:hypothetical protein
MDDTNAKWLDKKSPINHPLKGFCPTDLLLLQLIYLNPIFGLQLLEETSFLKKNVSILECSLIM